MTAPGTEPALRALAEALMDAEAAARCRGADGERVDRRNGYRPGTFRTPGGPVAVRVPRLRTGRYAPPWLGERSPAADELLGGVGQRPLAAEDVATLAAACQVSGVDGEQAAVVAALVNDATEAAAEAAAELPPEPSPPRRNVEVVVRWRGRDDTLAEDLDAAFARGRKLPLLLVAAAVLVLVAVVAAGWTRSSLQRSTPPPTPSTTLAPVTTAAPPPAPAPAAMVAVTPTPTTTTTTPAGCEPATAGDRVPWMEVVRCEAAASGG